MQDALDIFCAPTLKSVIFPSTQQIYYKNFGKYRKKQIEARMVRNKYQLLLES